MENRYTERVLGKAVGYGGLIITIFVAAWWATDPVNGAKMVALSSLGGSLVSILLNHFWSKTMNKDTKLVLGLVSIFCFYCILSSAFSTDVFYMNFYGVFGRNTGILTYICLGLTFLAASQITTKQSLDLVLRCFLIAGIINLVYCFLSILGIELIPWNNIYKTILGTLGNPDFISAFLAMLFVALFAKVLQKNISIWVRLVCILAMLIVIFEIKASHSIQGFAVIAIGSMILLWLKIRSLTNSKVFEVGYLIAAAIIGLAATLGALQIGPLTRFIYKTSISLRGQYWQAGLNMGFSHPFFGVGMDSYGNWYRRIRDVQAIVRPGVNTTSNAAHNVFIDIFASGGFPLLLIYLGLCALVIIAAIRIIRRSRTFDPLSASLIALWICYEAQSIISINQIGLAVWGWIFGGSIIAFDRISSDQIKVISKYHSKQISTRRVKQVSEVGTLLGIIVGALIGFLIAVPPFLADVKWRSAMLSGDVVRLESAAKSWPMDPARSNEGIKVLMDNKYTAKGIELTKLTVRKFPDTYISWYTYAQMPNLTQSEKLLILANLHRLDPLNPNLKQNP